MTYEINQLCFEEANNVSNSIARLIRLEIRRSNGDNVDDDIENEINSLTNKELSMKKCILRQVNDKLMNKSW